MKRTLLIFFCLISLFAKAQIFSDVNTWFDYDKIRAKRSLRPPQDTLSTSELGSLNVKNYKLYIRTPTGFAWVGGGDSANAGNSSFVTRSPLVYANGILSLPTVPADSVTGTKTHLFISDWNNSVLVAGNSTWLKYGDTSLLLNNYFRKADTISLHNQIAALQTQSGNTAAMKYQNGLQYNSGDNSVNAKYFSPIWNANRIQSYYVDISNHKQRSFLGLDTTQGIIRFMDIDSVMGVNAYDSAVMVTKTYFNNNLPLFTWYTIEPLYAVDDSTVAIRYVTANGQDGILSSAQYQDLLNGHAIDLSPYVLRSDFATAGGVDITYANIIDAPSFALQQSLMDTATILRNLINNIDLSGYPTRTELIDTATAIRNSLSGIANIYNSDGVLSGNRTVDLSNHKLTFSGGSSQFFALSNENPAMPYLYFEEIDATSTNTKVRIDAPVDGLNTKLNLYASSGDDANYSESNINMQSDKTEIFPYTSYIDAFSHQIQEQHQLRMRTGGIEFSGVHEDLTTGITNDSTNFYILNLPFVTSGQPGGEYQVYVDAAGQFYRKTGGIGTGSGAVSSVFGRTGAVTAQSGDYSSFYYPLSSNPAGYITSYTESDPIWTTDKSSYYTKTQSDARYLQSYTETDAIALAKTITINGTTQALSSNPTFTVDNSINLTTSGTSGAATWNSTTRTLNVPQYSGGSGTVTGGVINWPGTIYSTPTTATVSSGTLTFAPTLASQSAYKVLGTGSSTATPSFQSLSSTYLGDFNLGTPANGNLIKYNSTSGKWESGTVSFTELDPYSILNQNSSTQTANFNISGIGTMGLLNINGSSTASAGLARTVNISPSMTAVANNDNLIAVDIAPAYNNGSFTGLQNIAIRAKGFIIPSASLTYNLGAPANGWLNTYTQTVAAPNSSALNVAVTTSSQPIKFSFGSNIAAQFMGTTANFVLQKSGPSAPTDVSNVLFAVRATDRTSHPFPSMTEAQRTALTMTSSNYGDHVYQTDAGTSGEGVYIYKSTGWVKAY